MDNVLILNTVPTRLVTFDFDLNANHKDYDEFKPIILLIPGNPGVIEYYREFMSLIHYHVNLPIIGISHGGHIADEVSHPIPCHKTNPHLYDYNGQIVHKIAFIEEYIPENAKVIVIAHSIGAKITLEVMRRCDRFQKQVLKAFMLFPTVERMRETPNGRIFWALKSWQWLLFRLFRIPRLMPRFISTRLIRSYIEHRGGPECAKLATYLFIHHEVLQRVMAMGLAELENVKELDEDTINDNLDKLYFYFGQKDNWCPLEFAEGMIEKFPELKVKICEHGFEHAFVIKSSQEMGLIMSELLSELVNSYVTSSMTNIAS